MEILLCITLGFLHGWRHGSARWDSLNPIGEKGAQSVVLTTVELPVLPDIAWLSMTCWDLFRTVGNSVVHHQC